MTIIARQISLRKGDNTVGKKLGNFGVQITIGLIAGIILVISGAQNLLA